MKQGDPIQVKAQWFQPAYCRDDWAKIRLPNGYGYFCPLELIEVIGPTDCWVRATVGRKNEATRMVQVRFTDYHGEGSLDSVSQSLVRAVQ